MYNNMHIGYVRKFVIYVTSCTCKLQIIESDTTHD